MTLLWLCAALLVCLFCLLCYIECYVMMFYASSLIIFLYFMQGTTFGTCFELLEPLEMLMLYLVTLAGEYYQSVYVHHHYNVVHLAKRYTLLCLITCS